MAIRRRSWRTRRCARSTWGSMTRAMIRAYLLRSIGGGLGGPLRSLPRDSVARAKPALEAEHSTLGRANPRPSLASDVGVFQFRAPALPAQPLDGSPRTAGPQPRDVLRLALCPGGRFRKGGEAPRRVQRTGSTPRVRPSGAARLLQGRPALSGRAGDADHPRCVDPGARAREWGSGFSLGRPRSLHALEQALRRGRLLQAVSSRYLARRLAQLLPTIAALIRLTFCDGHRRRWRSARRQYGVVRHRTRGSVRPRLSPPPSHHRLD